MKYFSLSFFCNFFFFWSSALEFPKYSSLRVAYFTIFLTAILIMAYYSAALVCFLTSCTHVLPFRTMDEFLNDGTYKLIVPRGGSDYDVVAVSFIDDGQFVIIWSFLQEDFAFQTSSVSFSIKMMKVMKQESELPMSLIDGFVQVWSLLLEYLYQ